MFYILEFRMSNFLRNCQCWSFRQRGEDDNRRTPSLSESHARLLNHRFSPSSQKNFADTCTLPSTLYTLYNTLFNCVKLGNNYDCELIRWQRLVNIGRSKSLGRSVLLLFKKFCHSIHLCRVSRRQSFLIILHVNTHFPVYLPNFPLYSLFQQFK